MKNIKINLHMERKRALGIMLLFALLFTLVQIFTAILVKTDCAQLASLLRSDYIYSAISANPSLEDDYYRFDAGISFMLSSDAQASVNAEILMQSKDSDYTELIDWNVGELDIYEVAITEGLARKNGLKIGDRIYSNHVVDGAIHEYTVEWILPELASARIDKSGGYTQGVIIMGYDSKYIENIAHKSVVFTRESIEELTSKVSETPENIVYRLDEITAICMKFLPYFLLFALLSVILARAQVFIITKTLTHNFKRLIILGFEKRKLNSAYNRLVYTIGIASVIISGVIAAIISQLFVFSSVEAVILLALTFIELAALLVWARLSRRKLWR